MEMEVDMGMECFFFLRPTGSDGIQIPHLRQPPPTQKHRPPAAVLWERSRGAFPMNERIAAASTCW